MTAKEITDKLLSYEGPSSTELEATPESLVPAMATPGSYSLRVVPPLSVDKMVVMLRRMVEANGLRARTTVGGGIIFMDVKEKEA